MLVEQIEKYGIEYEREVYKGDAHGWGTGDGTPAAGWIARAVRFWEQHWKYN